MNKKQKLGPSEKIIQVYAKVSDLIRTEYIADKPEESKILIDDLIKKFDEEGILDTLKIKADGTVNRGNTRCIFAGIKNLEYLPIDLGFFIGLFRGDNEHIISIRKIIYDQEIDTVHPKCRSVKPPTTEEYRNKIGRSQGNKDFAINWSDEFVLLQSHFEQKEVSEKQDISQDFVYKKELVWLSRILDHWKNCDIDPTKKENCKWCHILFNAELSLKEELNHKR